MVSATLPVFAAILAGYILARLHSLGAVALGALNTYVLWLALPLLLFDFVAHANRATLVAPRFVLINAGAVVGTFALALLIGGEKQRLARRSLDALTAAYANTAFLGLPLCTALFGSTGTTAAIMATLVTVCVLFAVSVMLVELDRARGVSRARALSGCAGAMIRNPLIAAPLAGAAWAATGRSVPGTEFISLIGGSATPVALVTIGVFLAQPGTAPPQSAVFKVLLLKLLAQPLLTLALLAVFPLSAPWRSAALVLAALPTGTGPFIAAQFYGEEVALAARATLVSTILAAATVPLVAWWTA